MQDVRYQFCGAQEQRPRSSSRLARMTRRPEAIRRLTIRTELAKGDSLQSDRLHQASGEQLKTTQSANLFMMSANHNEMNHHHHHHHHQQNEREILLRLQGPPSTAPSQTKVGCRSKSRPLTSSTTMNTPSSLIKTNATNMIKTPFTKQCQSLISLLALVVLLLAIASNRFTQLAEAAKLPDIYWNSSNPIFRIDNSDHIFDVNKKQHDHDQVDLVCPQAQQQQQQQQVASADGNKTSEMLINDQQAQQERYIIYSVSKDEYDTCRLNGPGAQVVAKCDQPQASASGSSPRPVRPTTITFRSFTPQPNGLEFKPGQDYYFITALHGHLQDPHKRFSPCRELNMRVIFKVCCKPASGPSSTGGNGASSTGLTQQQPSKQATLPSLIASTSNNPKQRPPSVMTVRPTFKPLAGHFSVQPSHQPQQQQQQQQQPVTVLPIEVIQPASDVASQQPGELQEASSSTTNSNSLDVLFKNDIQNEQPLRPRGNQQPQQLSQPLPPRPFLAFDRNAAPEYLKSQNFGRWAPTPLPAQLRPSPRVIDQQHPAQRSAYLDAQPNQHLPAVLPPNQQQPAPWQRVHPDPRIGQLGGIGRHNSQQQPLPHNAPDQDRAGRIRFYPWPNGNEHQVAPTHDLITVAPSHDHQLQQTSTTGAASVGAPTYAVALLVPLLGLAILLALGLERRLR